MMDDAFYLAVMARADKRYPLDVIDATLAVAAERSPGVMPEAVKSLVAFAKDAKIYPEAIAAVEAHYSPLAGYEWQPVDAEHPITAEDLGRKVAHRCGGISGPIDSFSKNGTRSAAIGADGWDADGRYWTDSESGFDIVRILRPIAPPFEFAGEPGRYRTNNGEEVEVGLLNSRLVGVVVGNRTVSPDVPFYFQPDGTFAGGRIAGRVSEC